MRILGVDPGTRIVGWGAVEQEGSRIVWRGHGAIRPKLSLPFADRLLAIHEGLAEAIEVHSPECVSVEEVFYGKSVKAAIKIGEGRGVAILCAAQAGVPVAEYAATVVKKAVAGKGSAHKTQVQEMVRIILGLPEPPTPLDASDALALAICHCHRHRALSSRLV